MDEKQIIEWLLEGDVSIQYQVQRDLLGTERKDLQDRILNEGWGKQFLAEESQTDIGATVFISQNGFRHTIRYSTFATWNQIRTTVLFRNR